eukprot:13006948-Alexandrium_andersonii.AAC.1
MDMVSALNLHPIARHRCAIGYVLVFHHTLVCSRWREEPRCIIEHMCNTEASKAYVANACLLHHVRGAFNT